MVTYTYKNTYFIIIIHCRITVSHKRFSVCAELFFFSALKYKNTLKGLFEMKGTKYLSDAIHMNNIYSGMLNLVTAPVGCGKSYWALNVLSKTVSHPYKMVYLREYPNAIETAKSIIQRG